MLCRLGAAPQVFHVGCRNLSFPINLSLSAAQRSRAGHSLFRLPRSRASKQDFQAFISRDQVRVESGLAGINASECDCLKPIHRCSSEGPAILFNGGEASPIAIL